DADGAVRRGRWGAVGPGARPQRTDHDGAAVPPARRRARTAGVGRRPDGQAPELHEPRRQDEGAGRGVGARAGAAGDARDPRARSAPRRAPRRPFTPAPGLVADRGPRRAGPRVARRPGRAGAGLGALPSIDTGKRRELEAGRMSIALAVVLLVAPPVPFAH